METNLRYKIAETPVFHLDANRVNSMAKDAGVNRLERWHEEGVIFLEYSVEAYSEAESGSDSRRNKVDEYTWIEAVDNIGDEADRLRQIAKIVFPNGTQSPNQRNDVRILYTAWKAGAVLVTEDGDSKTQPRGILGSKSELAKIGIRVLSTAEAVSEIEAHLRRRKVENDLTRRST